MWWWHGVKEGRYAEGHRCAKKAVVVGWQEGRQQARSMRWRQAGKPVAREGRNLSVLSQVQIRKIKIGRERREIGRHY